MAKAKFKTFKKLIDEYTEKYDTDIDDYNRILEDAKTQDKFDKAFDKAYKYIEEFMQNAESLHIRLVLNQKVMKYHIPRSNGRGLYTPYISDFHQLVKDSTIAFREQFKLLGLPSTVKCTAYFPIPNNMKLHDKILAVIGFNRPITTPDVDNIIKFYNDTVKANIIFDDDLIYRSVSEKRYSFKPRVVVDIKAITMHTSEFNLNSFLSRDSVKKAISEGLLNLEFFDK